jgi:hypothetical protein
VKHIYYTGVIYDRQNIFIEQATDLFKTGVMVILFVVATLGDGIKKISMKNRIILDQFPDLKHTK